jgi:hypothetical protein
MIGTPLFSSLVMVKLARMLAASPPAACPLSGLAGIMKAGEE